MSIHTCMTIYTFASKADKESPPDTFLFSVGNKHFLLVKQMQRIYMTYPHMYIPKNHTHTSSCTILPLVSLGVEVGLVSRAESAGVSSKHTAYTYIYCG